MKTKLALIQTQKQVLAPLMQQSITVLLLPIMDLNQAIEQELQSNPLLELNESNEENIPPKDIEIHRSLERLAKLQDEPIDDNTFDEESLGEKPFARELPLEDYLMRQLRLEASDELQLKIGELIIGNIDEDGYLKVSCEEIAQLAQIQDIAFVERVLKLIQGFEPPGIASRDLKECLLVQLKLKNYNGAIVATVVNNHLEDIARKRYSNIARQTGVPPEEVKRIAKTIASLEPRPARNYRPIANNIYIKPDVFVTRDPVNGYQITINDEGIPRLRINPLYKNMLNRPDLKEEEQSFIRERLMGALHFMRSIEQRGQTILAITRYILERQKDFFEGNYLSIAPMTLKDVAAVINRNESTVSRAVNHKYIDTPQGLFPMKYFFSQALATTSNGRTSAQSIKEEIKELVETENHSSPLSDQDIQHYFAGKGVRLARRTVSKYREALHIPPSFLRRESRLN